ncbi:hypothetical protein BDZ97DRAFT_2057683 [Flammula alnicola]|nr:hypothetical protein BDZ97DRAFT_2057683 [Flammula alnicola]
MKNKRFAFPSPVADPIDSSRLVMRLRRPSLEDLRATNASPSPSLKGIYVRSRPTSAINENGSDVPLGMIFHPEDDYTEFRIASSEQTEGFASFASMHTKGNSGSSSATLVSSPDPIESVRDWEYKETAGPPPGYTLENDEEEIVYMQEERLARAQLQIASEELGRLVLNAAADTDTHSIAPSVRTNASKKTVKFAPTLKRTRRVANLKKGREGKVSTTTPPLTPVCEPGASVDNTPSAQADVPAKKRRLPAVYKVIRKTFFGKSTHSKSKSTSDALSTKSTVQGPEPSTQAQLTSVSMVDLTRRDSVKSSHPSISSKKNLLVKNRKRLDSNPLSTPSTDALLPPNSQAIETKALRRRSASFSGYTDVVPLKHPLLGALDENEVAEATSRAQNMPGDQWVYKPRTTEFPRSQDGADR